MSAGTQSVLEQWHMKVFTDAAGMAVVCINGHGMFPVSQLDIKCPGQYKYDPLTNAVLLNQFV